MTAPANVKSELAEAFAHVLEAVSAAGMYDEMIAMLVNLLTDRAVRSSNSSVEWVEYDDDDFFEVN